MASDVSDRTSNAMPLPLLGIIIAPMELRDQLYFFVGKIFEEAKLYTTCTSMHRSFMERHSYIQNLAWAEHVYNEAMARHAREREQSGRKPGSVAQLISFQL